MALEEYKRKRQFDQTPEPPPSLPKKAGHRFVVQEHRATRLHFDFRLELDGVLKSWAVPKGPSLDPSDKRLSMMVEDHPVSYFDFEGSIPEGNYGAGTVMVWDVGTWQPLSTTMVDGKYVPASDEEARSMIAKGDLKFRLSGQRLKGDFALIHMKARRPGSKGNEWLLIKKKDEHVVDGFDAEQYDTSILTKRTMDDIGGDDHSKQWTSSKPAGRGRVKAAWLADAVAKFDKQRAQQRKNEEATASGEDKPPKKTKSTAKTKITSAKSTKEKKTAKSSLKRTA